nr:DNA replication licensing factor MCM7-like [Anolis sagrei ordinatus]
MASGKGGEKLGLRGDYDAEMDKAASFLEGFFSSSSSSLPSDQAGKRFPYREQLTLLAHREASTLRVDLDDVAEEDPALAESACENAPRYQRLFADAAARLLPAYKQREVSTRHNRRGCREM